MVITIGCEYSASSPENRKDARQALGIEYYDRDLVDKTSTIWTWTKSSWKADKGTNVPYTFETTLGPALREPDKQVISLQYKPCKMTINHLRHHRPQRQLSAYRTGTNRSTSSSMPEGPHSRDHGKPIVSRREGARNRQLQRRGRTRQASVHHRLQSW